MTTDSSFERIWRSSSPKKYGSNHGTGTTERSTPYSSSAGTDVNSSPYDPYGRSRSPPPPSQARHNGAAYANSNYDYGNIDDDHDGITEEDHTYYTQADSLRAVQLDPDDDNVDIEFDLETNVVPENVQFDPNDKAKMEREMARAACDLSLSDKLTANSASSAGVGKRSSRRPAGRTKLEPVPEPDVACYAAINAGQNQAQQCNARAEPPPPPEQFEFTYETTARVPKKVPPFVFVHEDGQARVSMRPTATTTLLNDPDPSKGGGAGAVSGRRKRKRCTVMKIAIILIIIVLILSIITVIVGVLQKWRLNNDGGSSSEVQKTPGGNTTPTTTSSPTASPVATPSAATASPVTTGLPTPAPFVVQTLPPIFEVPTAATTGPIISLPPDSGIGPRDDTTEPTEAPGGGGGDVPTRAPRTRVPTQAPTTFGINPGGNTLMPNPSPITTPRATQTPTASPTSEPTFNPTATPTAVPTATPTQVPTASPTSMVRGVVQGIILQFAPGSYVDAITPGTPQNDALEWIVSEPNAEVTILRPPLRLLQRWVMATLFYAMDGPSWFVTTGWLSSSDECDWHFESTNPACTSNGFISNIYLEDNNLGGTLPKEIALLADSLRIVYLTDNSIGGPIPTEIGLMEDLRKCYIYMLSQLK